MLFIKMEGKFIWILLLFGLSYDLFVYGDAQNDNLKKTFCDAKYAFKFRIRSRVLYECFEMPKRRRPRSNVAATTDELYTTTVTAGTTLATAVSGLSAENGEEKDNTAPTTLASSTTQRQPTTNVVDTMTTDNIQSAAFPTSTAENDFSTDEVITTPPITTNIWITTKNTQEQSTTISVPNMVAENPTHQNTAWPTVRTKQSTDSTDSLATTTVSPTTTAKQTWTSPTHLTQQTTTDDVTARPLILVKTRDDCPLGYYPVASQRIKIMKKHIYKGNEGIPKMERVTVSPRNSQAYYSILRLGINLGKRYQLKQNQNYMFMGRKVPGQDEEEYVFLAANEKIVVAWEKARKYKKSLFMKHQDKCPKSLPL